MNTMPREISLKETDANGKVKEYAYDDYGRLTQATTLELVTTYTYKM